MKKVNLGIDLGGSHVAVGAVDLSGKILEQYEKDFTVKEKENLLPVAIQFMVDTIEMLEAKYNFSKVGVGMAGTISNGVVLKSVNLGIENFDMKKELEMKTGLQVVIKNDAKCVAIAEYQLEDLKPYSNVLFLTLGTGIGGSYIYHGKLMEGTVFEGCEFGHMVIKENGLPCRCGKKGCFEKYGSILAFKTKVMERLNLSYDMPGPALREIIDQSKPYIGDIIEEYIQDLSIGVSNLVNLFEPDCIVIGGGFARYDYLFRERLQETLLKSNLLFNARDAIMIKTAKLGNDAGVIGASIF